MTYWAALLPAAEQDARRRMKNAVERYDALAEELADYPERELDDALREADEEVDNANAVLGEFDL